MTESILSYRPHVCILVFLLVLGSGSRVSGYEEDLILAALGFSFLSAFVYLFNRRTDFKEDSINEESGILPEKTRDSLVYISLIFLVLPLVFLPKNFHLFLAYFSVAAIGVIYSKRISLFGTSFRLKEVFIGKNVSSALAWALPPALVPVALRGYWDPIDVMAFLVIFFIVLPIEIVWDVRDIEGDQRCGIKTIPNVWGVGRDKNNLFSPFWNLWFIDDGVCLFFLFHSRISHFYRAHFLY